MPSQDTFFPPYLNHGSEGPAVAMLQVILIMLYPRGELTITGKYDTLTTELVKRLQKRLGFSGRDLDGHFGPGTRNALKMQLGLDVNAIPYNDGAVFHQIFTHYFSPTGGGFWGTMPEPG